MVCTGMSISSQPASQSACSAVQCSEGVYRMHRLHCG
jgi:hypothetical protein